MKILILGHKGHGKTTLANMLTRYGFRVKDTSLINIERYAKEQKTTADAVLANKDKHRVGLFNSLREYTKDDGARFAKEVLAQYDVYVGMRSYEEYEASKHLFDLVIRIEDLNKPKESVESFDLQDHMPGNCHVIDNTSRTLWQVALDLEYVICSHLMISPQELRSVLATTKADPDLLRTILLRGY